MKRENLQARISVKWGNNILYSKHVELLPLVTALEKEVETARKTINHSKFIVEVKTPIGSMVRENRFKLFNCAGTAISKQAFERDILKRKEKQPQPIDQWRPKYGSSYFKGLVAVFTNLQVGKTSKVMVKLHESGYITSASFNVARITDKGLQYLYRILQKNLRCVRDNNVAGVIEKAAAELEKKGLLPPEGRNV